MKETGRVKLLLLFRQMFITAAEPQMQKLFGFKGRATEVFILFYRNKRTLKQISDHYQITQARVKFLKNRGIARIVQTLLESMHELKTLAGLKAENEKLRTENIAYKEHFGLLPPKINPQDTAVLNQPLDALNLDVRLSHVLKHAEIKTISDLMQWTEKRLLLQPDMGQKTLNILRELLAGMGLEMRKK